MHQSKDGTEVRQVVLPKQFHSQVLKVAHEVPLAGHMGRDRTTSRVLRRFYWPSLFQDMAVYCKSCPACQKTSKGRNRAPLISMPIMGEPFQRIAMDLVGPLPKTKRGHRYMLVIVDYASRYPEAIPLKTFTADVVAEKLVDVFARHGIPDTILTDQGTNFTSTLLKGLYQLLGVKALRTSPYHPQTDGLVE